VIWIATVVANVGTWMYNAASGWLITSLDADPLTVSTVQVASSLPMFLFALPAGALADTVDKRRFVATRATQLPSQPNRSTLPPQRKLPLSSSP
jgi:MFS family permease